MIMLVTIQSGPIGQLAFGWMMMLVTIQSEPWMNIPWKDDDVVTYSINPKWALDELVAFGQMWMLVYNQK
jgi:hypothetical protein